MLLVGLKQRRNVHRRRTGEAQQGQIGRCLPVCVLQDVPYRIALILVGLSQQNLAELRDCVWLRASSRRTQK